MISQAWSWALLVLSLTSTWLAGSGRISAWVVGLVSQALWLTYGVVTAQWGFAVSALAFAVVHGRNLVRARRRRRRARDRAEAGTS